MDVEDTFVRTAGDLNGSTTSDGKTTWVEDSGTLWATNGSQAYISATPSPEFYTARLALACDSADQYAALTLAAVTGAGTSILAWGVAVRTNAAGTAGYGFEVANSSGSWSRRIYNYATDANIASDSGVSSSAGDVLRLEAEGDSLRAYVNAGLVLSASGGGAWPGTTRGVGITVFTNDATHVISFSPFRGGDLTPVTASGCMEDRWFYEYAPSQHFVHHTRVGGKRALWHPNIGIQAPHLQAQRDKRSVII